MLSRLIQSNGEFGGQRVEFCWGCNEGRGHDHGVAGLAYHKVVRHRLITTEHGRSRIRCQSLAAIFVSHQLYRSKEPFHSDLADNGVVFKCP